MKGDWETRRKMVATEKTESQSESGESRGFSVGPETENVYLSLGLRVRQRGWWGLSWGCVRGWRWWSVPWRGTGAAPMGCCCRFFLPGRKKGSLGLRKNKMFMSF